MKLVIEVVGREEITLSQEDAQDWREVFEAIADWEPAERADEILDRTDVYRSDVYTEDAVTFYDDDGTQYGPYSYA